MFWRIVRRLLTANRGRLIVIFLALGAGAAVTSALLNLQVDAKRRLTTEFRTFGANVIVAPRQSSESVSSILNQSILGSIPSSLEGKDGVLAVLYVSASALSSDGRTTIPIIVAGVAGDIRAESTATPWDRSFVGQVSHHSPQPLCWVGARAASRLNIKLLSLLSLQTDVRKELCSVHEIRSLGGTEDDQVIVPLDLAQRLAGLIGKISLIEISDAGTPAEIQNYIAGLQKKLPEADVHGIRQFTEAEAKIYNRISGLLTATVAVVLILTTLCVMAAMTNVAMERKNDVGLMKALGGATPRVLRLFLAEAAVLGLVGGIVGAAAGILLSIALGKAVFGVAAQPRLIVYPVTVLLTILVAIASAYPLRRLASVRPASVFRGEA